ncbi:MAG: helix-turn-helix domain-containing protein [Candidatus Heimdallarchaeota archaeon]
MSVKEVSPELLADAGLSEKETQIYLAILGLGNATIGQIAQLTGLDVFEISERIPNLESLGYIKKLPGILHRFIPMEPFLRAFVDIDKRFRIDIAQIKDAFTNNVYDFAQKIDVTYGNLTHLLELAQGRFKAPDILPTTEKRLEELFTEQKSNFVTVKEKGTEDLKNTVADLTEKLMRQVGERQGIVAQLTFGTIDAVKTSLETSRHTLSSLNSDLSSELQSETETLKSDLFSTMDQQVDFHDRMKQEIIQKVENTVDKYQVEFARSSDFLKEDFSRLADNQSEKITKVHENLKLSLQNVYDNITKEWDKTSSNIQPKLDTVNTKISELGRRLRALGEEIKTIKVGFRKPFPQEEFAAKTEALATEMEMFVKDAKSLIENLNTPIQAAFVGSQTMTQETEGIITGVTTTAQEELENLKQEANKSIGATLRDFKADLMTDNREQLEDYCSKVEKGVIKTKEGVDSQITEWLKTQIDRINQYTPNADHLHTEATNQAEIGLTRTRKEVEAILDEHGKTIQAFLKAKENIVAESFGDHIEVFHTKTDNLNTTIKEQLKTYFETLTISLEQAGTEIQAAIEPVITQMKDSAKEVELAVGEKIIAAVMRTEAAETALSKIQEASAKIKPVETAQTWAILGKQNIGPLVNDMLERTKSSITILVPELSGDLLQRIADVPHTRKITLVSEIDIDHYERELGQLLDQGNVQLRHYAKKDMNMCLRDAEEVFIALETPEEEFVTILTESELLVRLLQKVLLSEFVSIAKPVKF